MENLLLAALGVGLWASAQAYLYARDKYGNHQCGGRFRDWVLGHATAILNDDTATDTAQMAAVSMLAHLYDNALLSKAALQTSAPAANIASLDEKCGRYAADVQEAFGCLAVLAILEDRRPGVAMRRLIGDAAPGDAVSDLFGSIGARRMAGRFTRRGSDGTSTAQFDEVLEALSHFPKGRQMRRNLLDCAVQAMSW